MNLIKKFSTVGLVILITVALLELGSLILLKLRSTSLSAVQKEFVFKQVDSSGQFRPTKEYVLPIRENARFQWNADEFSVEVRTNSFGLRENFEIKLSEIEAAFFGDSFTFGHGVEGDERYSFIYASKLPVNKRDRVVSLSYKNGFQPEHYEFYFRNNEDLRPKRVVVGLYLGNDLGSDLTETNYDNSTNELTLPYRRIFSEGQIGNSPTAFRFPLNKLADSSNFVELFLKVVGKTPFRSSLFRDGFEGPNTPNNIQLELGDTELLSNGAMQSLGRLQTLVESRGGKLTILLIPQNYFFGDGNPHIHTELKKNLEMLRRGRSLLSETISACVTLKLDCFDSRPYLIRESYFANDAHWNAKGHSQVGNALFSYLN